MLADDPSCTLIGHVRSHNVFSIPYNSLYGSVYGTTLCSLGFSTANISY
jgi:hypothetical protein